MYYQISDTCEKISLLGSKTTVLLTLQPVQVHNFMTLSKKILRNPVVSSTEAVACATQSVNCSPGGERVCKSTTVGRGWSGCFFFANAPVCSCLEYSKDSPENADTLVTVYQIDLNTVKAKSILSDTRLRDGHSEACAAQSGLNCTASASTILSRGHTIHTMKLKNLLTMGIDCVMQPERTAMKKYLVTYRSNKEDHGVNLDYDPSDVLGSPEFFEKIISNNLYQISGCYDD